MSLYVGQAFLTKYSVKPNIKHSLPGQNSGFVKTLPLLNSWCVNTKGNLFFAGLEKPDFKKLNQLINQSELCQKLKSYYCKELGKPLNLNAMWVELPYSMQKMLNSFLKGKKPDRSLEKALLSGKMGILEESADLLYETLLLAAIKEGVFNESLVDKSLKFIKFDPKGKHLSKAIKDIEQWIPYDDARKFCMISGLRMAEAKEFIALNYLKFAALRLENRCDKIHSTVIRQALDEYVELAACFPPLKAMPKRDNRRKRIGNLQGLLNNLQNHNMRQDGNHVLIKSLRHEIEKLLQDTLGKGFSEKTLLDFIHFKQSLRQSIRLENIHKFDMSYDRRKSIVKPFEVLIEAVLLDSIN